MCCEMCRPFSSSLKSAEKCAVQKCLTNVLEKAAQKVGFLVSRAIKITAVATADLQHKVLLVR